MAISCTSNLKDFALARPPLVVFTICLLVLSLASIFLARYVDHAEKLEDPDYPYDWRKILTTMEKLELCARPEKSSAGKSSFKTNSNDPIISKTAEIRLPYVGHNKLSNYANISGTILHSDGSNITISFVLVTNATSSDHTICATFTGPQSKMPQSEYSYQCQSNVTYPTGIYFNFFARNKHEEKSNTSPNWCSDGTELQLDYIHYLYLEESDKEIIKMHLLHFSFFLLSVALALIFYAMVKGRRSHSPLGDHSKMPLGL